MLKITVNPDPEYNKEIKRQWLWMCYQPLWVVWRWHDGFVLVSARRTIRV